MGAAVHTEARIPVRKVDWRAAQRLIVSAFHARAWLYAAACETAPHCSAHGLVSDTLAERPRRGHAKPMGDTRVGSNRTGVVSSKRVCVRVDASSARVVRKLKLNWHSSS
jgi:hypothetical protein